jgi:hypothetical protein
MKGVDISMTSCTSELQYLANLVNNPTQSFEQHNYDVNSWDIKLDRKPIESIEILKLMLSTYLTSFFQALYLCHFRWIYVFIFYTFTTK